jgi:hypothetical protein
MAARFYVLCVDSHDPIALGQWWAKALDWPICQIEDGEVLVARGEDVYPALLFLRVPDEKTVKNRLHIDLAADDQAVEVERLIELGATPADIGQGEQTWVVLRDPEGNEFCVLSSRSGGM